MHSRVHTCQNAANVTGIRSGGSGPGEGAGAGRPGRRPGLPRSCSAPPEAAMPPGACCPAASGQAASGDRDGEVTRCAPPGALRPGDGLRALDICTPAPLHRRQVAPTAARVQTKPVGCRNILAGVLIRKC